MNHSNYSKSNNKPHIKSAVMLKVNLIFLIIIQGINHNSDIIQFHHARMLCYLYSTII